MSQVKPIQKILLIFPLVLTFGILLIRQYYYSLYEILGVEDGFFENIQFLCFLIGAIVSISMIRLERNKFLRIFWIVSTLGFALIALEEISWGQRIFDANTFGLFAEHNVQQEINLHNLSVVYDEVRYFNILLGIWGTFSWIPYLFIKFNYSQKNDLTRTLALLFLNKWYLPFYFLPLLINIINTAFLAPQDHEYFEFLSSIGLLLFIIDLKIRFTKVKPTYP